VLELAYVALAMTEPKSPAASQHLLQWAQRGANLTHHKLASWMLLLAEADRDNGSSAAAKRDAQEGLALLSPSAANQKPRVYKLLLALSQ
jgi:hypothetical protein